MIVYLYYEWEVPGWVRDDISHFKGSNFSYTLLSSDKGLDLISFLSDLRFSHRTLVVLYSKQLRRTV